MEWVWFFIEATHKLHDEVIHFNSRFDGWNGKSQALLTVNHVVNFQVQQQWPFDPQMFDHKQNSDGLMYQFAFGIFCGLICWVNGPFKAAAGEKEAIASECLTHAIEWWELIEWEGGFQHKNDQRENHDDHLNNLMYKMLYHNRNVAHQKAIHHALNEIFHSKIKSFGALCQVFRNGIEKHGWCVFAVVVVVQMMLKELEDYENKLCCHL
jgi:hypothetical protein